MSKKGTAEYIKALQIFHNVGNVVKYNPATQFLAELALMNTKKLTSIGGEQPLNDANTKVLVGVSDFNGTLTPTDAIGLIRALSVKYSSQPAATTGFDATPAGQVYTEIKSEFPAWLLNSEIVMRTGGIENFRMRVSETVLLDKAQLIPSETAKEFEKFIKVTGGQDLQIFLSTPEGAVMDDTKQHFVRTDLYGIKFGDRKI
ncbi:MAG: hypothetical protein HGA42_00615 [Nostocales cyanobacterium W4_Combined_metabat2_030]|nr:hypothetical protein [Nostocales cyanobacterium W4_Combined_metabat2_030]